MASFRLKIEITGRTEESKISMEIVDKYKDLVKNLEEVLTTTNERETGITTTHGLVQLNSREGELSSSLSLVGTHKITTSVTTSEGTILS